MIELIKTVQSQTDDVTKYVFKVDGTVVEPVSSTNTMVSTSSACRRRLGAVWAASSAR